MDEPEAVPDPTRKAFARSGTPRPMEWLLVLGAFVAVNWLSAAFQEPISFNEGRGSDGVVYVGVATQFSGGVRPEGRAPFVYRIGTPLLATLVPGPLRLGDFEVVNIVGNAIACALLLLWLRLYLDDWRVRTALVVCFISQWHGPVRYVHYYPASVEPWIHVFLLAGLILMQRARENPRPIRIVALAVVSAVGVLFREVMLLVPLAFCFAVFPIRGERRSSPAIAFGLPLLSGVVALLCVRSLVIQVNDYSFGAQAMRFLAEKSLWRYVLAIFIAFGPVVVVPLYDWRGSLRFLSSHKPLLAFGAATALLAFVGGSDTERFLYWSMPVVYVLIGRAIEHRRHAFGIGLAVALIAAQSLSQRLFWVIPDFPGDFPHRLPLLTPTSSEVPYTDLLALASPRVGGWALVEFALLGVVTLIALSVRERRVPPSAHVRSG